MFNEVEEGMTTGGKKDRKESHFHALFVSITEHDDL
jgi:hypothetical protein